MVERRESWHRKDCSTCLYRHRDTCRRFPPSLNWQYPVVRKDYEFSEDGYIWMGACAEHMDVEGRAKKGNKI